MRTTTRSSELIAALLATGCMTGTAHRPENRVFALTPESAAHRAAQTRRFETDDDRELLSASAAVLQDLGFHVTECVRDLGFLRAAKERSAREHDQTMNRGMVLILSFGRSLVPIDLHQKICASLVARPIEAGRHEVRITFYRIVWKGDGMAGDNYIAPGAQRMEVIRDAEIYQQFFAKLSKAVFLEAFTI